jgi:mandelate racemase
MTALPKLTIRDVTVRPVLVPLARPVIARVGAFTEWPLILIDLATEEGITGRSYLAPYIAKSARYLVPAIHDLVSEMKGQPVAPVDMFQAARKSLNLVGLEGQSLIAVSGLDMAAWDALARAAELPLASLLGGTLAPVPAYNSNGLWLTPLESLADEAGQLVAEGDFDALKLRIGRDALADDIAAIAAVRQAAGDGVKLMCDFNQGLGLEAALARCHALDDQGLTWFEEPIPYDDMNGYAKLTDDLRTPVQLGENFYGPRVLFQALQAGAGDLYMPDLMRIGGVTGWLRSAAICGAAGVPMSSHLYPEFSAHLMRVTETAHWLEWQDWSHPILQRPYTVSDGTITIPETPGVGLEWDEDAVTRYAMEI